MTNLINSRFKYVNHWGEILYFTVTSQGSENQMPFVKNERGMKFMLCEITIL